MSDSAEEAALVLEAHREDCEGALSAFRRDLGKMRTGRASAGLLEGMVVEYYGAKTPLTSLAQVSAPEARLIMLQVFDGGAVAAIEKAIMSSGLGLNPSSDGNVIRLNVPPLTEETRRDIIKMLHKLAEDIRVSIRGHRRDANDNLKKLEKAGDLTKDDNKKSQERVQKQTDEFIAEVDKLLSQKEAEILEV